MLKLFSKKPDNIVEVVTRLDNLEDKLDDVFSPFMREYKQSRLSVQLPNNVYYVHSTDDFYWLMDVLGWDNTGMSETMMVNYGLSRYWEESYSKDGLWYWSRRAKDMMYTEDKVVIGRELKKADIIIDSAKKEEYSLVNAYHDLWKFKGLLYKDLEHIYTRKGYVYKANKSSSLKLRVDLLSSNADFIDLVYKLEELGRDDELYVEMLKRDSKFLEELFSPLQEYTKFLLKEDKLGVLARDTAKELDKLSDWSSKRLHKVEKPAGWEVK